MKGQSSGQQQTVTVITGASSGIGRATAVEMAARGSQLIIAARGKQGLEECAEECRARGASVLVVPTDVTNPDQIERLSTEAVKQFGRFDIWINAAGVAAFGRFLDIPAECFTRVMQTNFLGTVCGSREALKHFRHNGTGVLINVASVLGKEAIPYMSPYVASKQAIIGLSSSLRQEFGQKEISICTILPAAIDTPIWQHGANYTGRQIRPVWPVYSPEEVAKAIADCGERPRRFVYVGGVGKLITLAHTLTPKLYERLGPSVTEVMLFKNGTASRTHGNLQVPSAPASIHGGWQNLRPPSKWVPWISAGMVAIWVWSHFIQMKTDSHASRLAATTI